MIRRASIRPHKDQGDFLKVIQVGMGGVPI
jgi:hypothetical protein